MGPEPVTDALLYEHRGRKSPAAKPAMTTAISRNISRATWKSAELHMKQAGWENILSACSSAGDSIDEFGTLYIRDGQEFWLNYRTIGSLPA